MYMIRRFMKLHAKMEQKTYHFLHSAVELDNSAPSSASPSRISGEGSLERQEPDNGCGHFDTREPSAPCWWRGALLVAVGWGLRTCHIGIQRLAALPLQVRLQGLLQQGLLL